MSVVRVVFLGTPEFARHHLQGLLKDEHFHVVGVATQPDRPSGRNMRLTPSPVKQLALEQNIPVITPEKVNDLGVLEQFEKWGAEAAVVVAFGQILPQAFLDLYPQRVVNVHASLLPRWRGAAPIQRAIMAGDTETGVALQVMVKKLDAGDVLGVRKVAITDDMDAVTMHDELKVQGADLLAVEFMDYLRGNLMPVAQDESKVTYAHKIEKSEGQVDWQKSARQLFNEMRGLALGPGVHTYRQGKKLKILKAHPVARPSAATPGQVVEANKDSFTVACGSEALQVFEVQPESKARQLVSEYLKGYPVVQGELFGQHTAK